MQARVYDAIFRLHVLDYHKPGVQTGRQRMPFEARCSSDDGREMEKSRLTGSPGLHDSHVRVLTLDEDEDIIVAEGYNPSKGKRELAVRGNFFVW